MNYEYLISNDCFFQNHYALIFNLKIFFAKKIIMHKYLILKIFFANL